MVTTFQQALDAGMSYSQAVTAAKQASAQQYAGTTNAYLGGYGLTPAPTNVGSPASWMNPPSAATTTPLPKTDITTGASFNTTPVLNASPQGQNTTGGTYEEAAAEAARTGGSVGWSQSRGYYVIPSPAVTNARVTMGPTTANTPPNPALVTTPNLTPPLSSDKVTAGQNYPVTPLSTLLKPISSKTPSTQTTTPVATTTTSAQAELDAFKKAQGLGDKDSKDKLVPLATPLTPTGDYEEKNGWFAPVYTWSDGSVHADWDRARQIQTTPTQRATFDRPQDETYTDSMGNTWNTNYTLDRESGRWFPDPQMIKSVPEGMTEYQRQQLELQRAEVERQKQQAARDEEYRRLKQQQDAQAAADALATQRAGQESTLSWYREQQTNELAAQRQQQLASLKANPSSWLEYATLSGEPAAVQPWMLPLASKDYGFQLGEPIPGWNVGGTGTLPELQSPSTQYLARLTPSQKKQYYAYIAAQTGMRPEDVESKLWSMAPSGGYGGLRNVQYTR